MGHQARKFSTASVTFNAATAADVALAVAKSFRHFASLKARAREIAPDWAAQHSPEKLVRYLVE